MTLLYSSPHIQPPQESQYAATPTRLRVQVALPTTIRLTVYDENGVPVVNAVDHATITITDSTGATIASGTAPLVDTGVYAFAFTAARLDTLTVTWVTGYGTFQTTVEVVGGFYFTISEAKATAGLSGKTVGEIEAARMYAEDELDQACGVAFVPRFAADTFSLPYSQTMTVARPKIRAVRFARSDTTSLAATAIAFTPEGGIDLSPSLPIANSAWWKRYRTITLGYEHGWDSVPPAVSRAALIIARDYLTQGPVADRAIQQPTEFGPVYLASPGFKGKRFGIPAVDAVVEAYSYRPAQIHSLSAAGAPPAGTLYPDQFQ